MSEESSSGTNQQQPSSSSTGGTNDDGSYAYFFNKGFDNKKDTFFNGEVGNFSTKFDANPKPSGLRVGNLQIGGDVMNLKKFVYVPEGFDFRTSENMEQLFKALGIDEPDLVFRFGKNYSVVPSLETKTINEWQDDYKSLKVPSPFGLEEEETSPGETEGLQTPKKNGWSKGNKSLGSGTLSPTLVTNFPNKTTNGDGDISGLEANRAGRKNAGEGREKKAERIRRVSANTIQAEDTKNVFSAISDFKKTIFLITNPFRGNDLSEIALNTLEHASDSTVESIGLFHTDPTKVLDGHLTVLKEYSLSNKGTPYEQSIKENIKKTKDKKDWMRFSAFEEAKEEVNDDKGEGEELTLTRMPIPDEVFRHCSVLCNDTPTRKAIRVDCQLTPGEEKRKKAHHGITRIPGGLAHKCGHRLVFTSKKRMKEFCDFICDTHSTGFFACGGSCHDFQIAKNALTSGKPLFAIEGTGFVPTVVNHFFNSATSDSNGTEMNKRKSEFRKVSGKLKALVRKSMVSYTNQFVKSDSIDELLYEEKLLDLVDSLDAFIYEVDEEIIVKDFFKNPDSNARMIRRFDGKTMEGMVCIKVSSRSEEHNDTPWEDMFFKLHQLRDVDPPEGQDLDHPAETDIYDHNRVDKHEMWLKEISIKEILRDKKESYRTKDKKDDYDLCKIFPRKNSSGDEDGWILVQVPKEDGGTKKRIPIEKGLGRAKRTSNLVKNFMNYPRKELEIDQLLNEADVPIIGVDYEGKIIQWNQKSKEVFGEFEQGLDLFDTLAKKLLPMSERKKELKSFLRKSLEENVSTPQTFKIDVDMIERRADIYNNEGFCGQHGSDTCMHLSLTCIPRPDRDKRGIILGAYFLFQDNTIRTPVLKTPMPMDEKTLDLGEVLVKSDRGAINKFNEDAFYLIKSHCDTSELKDKISHVMSTASDWVSELGGQDKNNEAIDECDKLIEDAHRARKRYYRQAVFFQFAVQVLVLVTTTLTILKVHCKSDQEGTFCKGVAKGDDVITAFVISLPIVAAIFQTLIYTFRPKWKSARLILMEKRLESEMFKFRARVGPYNAFHSKKVGSHDSVRKKFIERCQEYYDLCVRSEFKSGTMNINWKIYERDVKPYLERCRCRISLTSNRDSSSARSDQVLSRPIWPHWFLSEFRTKWRENKVGKKINKKEERNRDLEAQNEGGHPIYLTDEEKRLIGILEEEEERQAKIKRKKKEAADHKQKYCILSIDEYKRKRLEPKLNKFKSHLPQVVFWRNILQICIVLFTSGSTLLGALPTDEDRQLAFLIPIFLALAAFLGNMLSFFRYETRVPVLHESCIGGLQRAMLEMNSPATLERRLQTQKEQIIFMVEESILSYYHFMVEDELENGLEGTLNQDSTKNGEGQQKATSPKSSGEIRNNGNNNGAGNRLLREG